MRLIVAGQVPTAPADRDLFFQDVSLLLQALLGLAVGEDQVRTWLWYQLLVAVVDLRRIMCARELGFFSRDWSIRHCGRGDASVLVYAGTAFLHDVLRLAVFFVCFRRLGQPLSVLYRPLICISVGRICVEVYICLVFSAWTCMHVRRLSH